jgi:hypothetical protein
MELHGSPGTHAARKGEAAAATGGPPPGPAEPLGAYNGTLCPQVGVHGGGSLRPGEVAGWREPGPSLLDITLHWTRERRPVHRPGRAQALLAISASTTF